ncbi:MAG: hypothetical protein RsTaC01_1059 [Candidatus Paraimprobicoccus trichonymphae]|uniref:Uncharacterized protein n=1 Tax=Candidatus Paraimprobicoccus trichonymphae TaxID=3033793 RepID=A0AA48I6P9_9FIRM|nr:MAG: hypothetical protein RsTaC01_1059 [Candidatus Paraimprobicoccus trichonymphae]
MYSTSNSDNINKMQQEAMARVKEMQAKAKEYISQAPTSSNLENFQEDLVPRAEIPSDNKNVKELKTKKNENNNLLNSLFEDKEKSLILTLIFILLSEQDENNLVISLILIYLLL